AVRGLDQAPGPGGVAGVGDGRAAEAEPQGQRRRTARVVYFPSRDLDAGHGRRAAWRQFYDVDAEAAVRSWRAGERCLHGVPEALRGAWRPCDRQRPVPPAELAVEDQERQPPEVVAMQ